MKIDGSIFFHTGKELPPEIFARIKRNPRWLVHSLGGSIEQLADSWLQKLLLNEEKANKQWDAIHQLHQQQASFNATSRYMSLPYDHISLVTNRTSTDTIASSILDFIR